MEDIIVEFPEDEYVEVDSKLGKKIVRHEKLKQSGLTHVPVLGSVIRAVTGGIPHSIADGLLMDITEAAISIIPVAGDLAIGGIRTARYTIHKEIPDDVRGKLLALSAIDMGVGVVPVIGDAIDFALITNTITYASIKKSRGEKLHFFKSNNDE